MVGQKSSRLAQLFRPATASREQLGTADEQDLAAPAERGLLAAPAGRGLLAAPAGRGLLAAPAGRGYLVEVERGKLLPLVFKIAISDNLHQTMLPSRSSPGKLNAFAIPHFTMMSTQAIVDYGHLEILTYFVLDRFIAPYVPNVPALNACFPCYDERVRRSFHVQNMAAKDNVTTFTPLLKVEEYLYGKTVYDLLVDKRYERTRDSLRADDWYSLIWQMLMAHYYMIKQAGLVHFDPHMDNAMVSIQEKPSKIAYKAGDVTIVTPESSVLLVRIDWSRSVALGALDEWSRRFILSQYGLFLGQFTRKKMSAEETSSMA